MKRHSQASLPAPLPPVTDQQLEDAARTWMLAETDVESDLAMITLNDLLDRWDRDRTTAATISQHLDP